MHELVPVQVSWFLLSQQFEWADVSFQISSENDGNKEESVEAKEFLSKGDETELWEFRTELEGSPKIEYVSCQI